MKLQSLYSLGLITVFVCLAFGGVSSAETLDASVLSALQQHPSVEAAKASLDSAKETRTEQFSNYFPEVSLSAGAGRIYGNNATSRGLVTTRGEAYSWLGEGSVNVRQRIFDGMETSSKVDAAEARKKKAYNSLFEVREGLALRAVQSYINVLRGREAVAMLKTHKGKVADYLGRIQKMLNEGAADETQVQQAKDIQVILEGILADFEGQLLGAEAQYYEAVGYKPSPKLEPPSVPLDVIPRDIATAVDYALNNHPSIAVANDDSRAASYDIGAEKSALYPDLNGEMSYSKKDQRDEIGGESEDGRATLRLNWDFSTGGAQFARIRRSKSTHQESLARMNDLRGQIERDVHVAYAEYDTAGKQLELLGQRRSLNEKLFKTYQAQFEGAKVTVLQLMQADNQLFNTKLEGVNGRYRLLAAQYAMLAGMGRLQNAMNLDQIAMAPDWQQNYTAPASVAPAAGEEEVRDVAPVEAVPTSVSADDLLNADSKNRIKKY